MDNTDLQERIESDISTVKQNPIITLIDKSQGLLISVAILVILLLIAAIWIPRVYSIINFENMLRVTAPAGIIAIGLSLVMIGGEMDVSVGAIMTLSMAVAARLYDINEPLAMIGALLAGLIAGLINGTVVTMFKAPSLMITIGGISLYTGLASILVKAQKKYIVEAYTITAWLSKGKLLGIAVPVFTCVSLAIIVEILLRKSKYGKELYYIGANRRAAWMSGVKIDGIRIACFVICGVCCAIAGPMLAGQLGSATVIMGKGYEIDAISIAVLGGVSLSGGKGTAIGTLLGYLTISLMQNMLSIAGFDNYTATVIKGALIILVVFLYGFTALKRE